MDIPCRNCLVLPMCRHKPYIHILLKCQSIQNFLYPYGTVEMPQLKEFSKLMGPTRVKEIIGIEDEISM